MGQQDGSKRRPEFVEVIFALIGFFFLYPLLMLLNIFGVSIGELREGSRMFTDLTESDIMLLLQVINCQFVTAGECM